MLQKKSFLALLFIALLSVFAPDKAFSQITKGLYVDDFYSIIQNKNEQIKLLEMAKSLNVNYLILYQMAEIDDMLFHLNDSVDSAPLSEFISLAKTSYGIKNIGAVSENADFFNEVVAYNNFYKLKASRRFNYINLEFEFWNRRSTGDTGVYCRRYLQPKGEKCTIESAFEHYKVQLLKTDSIARANGLKSETYIGNVDSVQCTFISQHVSRILVHHYRQSDLFSNGTSIYQFKNERYKYLTSLGNKITIMPIFASTNEFMGPWLALNNEQDAHNTYLNGLEGYRQESRTVRSLISMSGYVWYNYTSLRKNYIADDKITSVEDESATEKLYFIKNNTLYYRADAECNIYNTHGSTVPMNVSFDEDFKSVLLAPGHMYIIKIVSSSQMATFKIVTQ